MEVERSPVADPSRWENEIRWARITKRRDELRLVVDAAPVGEEGFLDARGLVDEIWRGYGQIALERGISLLEREPLDRIALPREIIVSHFLTEFYRPHAFGSIVAARLAEQLEEGQQRLVCLPVTAGDPSELAECFKTLGGRRTRWKGWLGCLVGVLAVTAGIVRLPKSPRSIDRSSGGLIAALYGDKGTHTSHVWKWLDGRSDVPVLVLGHKPLDPELRLRAERAGVKVLHPLALSDIPRAIIKLLGFWSGILKLHRAVEEDLGIRATIAEQAKSAGWFFRGLLHRAWIEREIPSARTSVVFGLIAHADSRIADLTLRERGAETIHWLHGIVEDALHFRAHCSLCLCVTPNDARMRERHGCYGRCVSPVENQHVAAASEAPSGLLVVTNLIHPDNRFIRCGGPEALRLLIHTIAHLGEEVGPIVWRPHPRESASPLFKNFAVMASELGVEIDNDAPFQEQMKRFRRVVSTPSTTIGDLAGSGIVPAVYDVLPFETEGHMGRLPEELRFHDLLGLRRVIGDLEDAGFRRRTLDLLSVEYPQRRLAPEDFGCQRESH